MDKDLQIIDFYRKGNVIRFYLGKYTKEYGWLNPERFNTDSWAWHDGINRSETYFGDDWDDAPYECNAETVYDEFIYDQVDVALPLDTLVLEPVNYSITKNDFVARQLPCLIIVSGAKASEADDYAYYLNAKSEDIGNDTKITKVYFGNLFTSFKDIWKVL